MHNVKHFFDQKAAHELTKFKNCKKLIKNVVQQL